MNIKKVSKISPGSLGVSLILAAFMLFFGLHNAFAQDQFLMTPKELNDFKLAKKYNYQGEQQFLKKKYQKAWESFNKCLDVFPRYSSADYYLAKICYQRQEYKQALTHINSAMKNFKIMDNMALDAQLQYFKRLREEKNNLTAVLNDPMQKLTDYARKEMRLKLRQIDEHLRDPLPEAQHIPADYHYVHGNIFFKLKKFKEAHDRFVETIRLAPRHANAYNNLISLFYMVKQFPKAEEYIKQAESYSVKVNPKLKDAVLKNREK